MHIYPHKSEQLLNEAKIALKRMSLSVDIPNFKGAFVSFLNASRFSLQSFKKDYKDINGFDTWWAKKAVLLERDYLCSFFKNLRNKVIKEGKDPFSIHMHMKGPMILNGPLQIGSEGILKEIIDDGRPRFIPMSVRGVAIQISLNEVPKGFEDLNFISLCESYLKILSDIIDEFVLNFSKAKN